MYLYVCMHVCMYVRMYMLAHMYMNVYVNVHRTYVYIYMIWSWTGILTSFQMDTRPMPILKILSKTVYIHVYIYIYTHTYIIWSWTGILTSFQMDTRPKKIFKILRKTGCRCTFTRHEGTLCLYMYVIWHLCLCKGSLCVSVVICAYVKVACALVRRHIHLCMQSAYWAFGAFWLHTELLLLFDCILSFCCFSQQRAVSLTYNVVCM